MRRQFQKDRALKPVRCGESRISEASRAEICWTDYPSPIIQDGELSLKPSEVGLGIVFDFPGKFPGADDLSDNVEGSQNAAHHSWRQSVLPRQKQAADGNIVQ